MMNCKQNNLVIEIRKICAGKLLNCSKLLLIPTALMFETWENSALHVMSSYSYVYFNCRGNYVTALSTPDDQRERRARLSDILHHVQDRFFGFTATEVSL